PEPPARVSRTASPATRATTTRAATATRTRGRRRAAAWWTGGLPECSGSAGGAHTSGPVPVSRLSPVLMTDLLPESRRGYSLPAMASTTDGGSTAARQWADELAAWRIDPEIRASVRHSSSGFPPAVCAAGQTAEPSPLDLLARPALRPGGTVLDVGAGA